MKIRLPEELRGRIAREAEANKRSLNAEITARLQFSFDAEEDRQQSAEFHAQQQHERAQAEYEKAKSLMDALAIQIEQHKHMVEASMHLMEQVRAERRRDQKS